MSEMQEWSGDPNPTANGVGDRLKAERVARGLSLDDVSQTLKITPRVLEQVEGNAWGALPGWTFARGVVRGYARFLQMDPEPLLRQLESAPLPKPPALDLPASTRAALPVPGQSEGRDRLTAVAGVLAVAAAVMAYFLVPEEWIGNIGQRPSSSTKPMVEAPASVSSTATAPSPAVTAEPGNAPAPSLPAPVTTESAGPAVPVVPQAAVAPVVPATPATAAAPAPATTPVQKPSPVAATAAANPAGVVSSTLTLKFVEGSWVEVKDRTGKMVLQENVAAGATRSVSAAPPLGLALGNADGVTAVFGGRTVDLKPHTRQRVARLTLE